MDTVQKLMSAALVVPAVALKSDAMDDRVGQRHFVLSWFTVKCNFVSFVLAG